MDHALPSDVLAARPASRVALWIGGGPRETAEWAPTIAPATGEPLAQSGVAGAVDVDDAITSAHEAQETWSQTPMLERARLVRRLAGRIAELADDFGLLDAHDTGTPVRTMRVGAQKGADYLRTAAGVAIDVQGRSIPASGTGWHVTFPRPLGVVVGIAAFNHPTLFACQKIGPALIAGNAVILKPSEQAPLSGLLIGALTQELLPPGVLNVVSGGAGVGEQLAADARVDAITFTGGAATGRSIQAAAARSGTFKRLVLELGGKNPILVYPDADLDAAARAVVRGMNYTRNQGQSCGSTSRLIVHRDIRHELVERVIAAVGSITLGLPDREETEMGSLISRAHRDRIVAAIRCAEAQGAKVVRGGTAPDDGDLAGGAYLHATVVDDVTPDMQIARDELFGPVLSIITCDSDDVMIGVANDTEYGLTASIWSQDIDRALATAGRLDCGYIWINDVETRYSGVPHGGWKQSGSGLEQALTDEIQQFMHLKSVNIAIRRPRGSGSPAPTAVLGRGAG